MVYKPKQTDICQTNSYILKAAHLSLKYSILQSFQNTNMMYFMTFVLFSICHSTGVNSKPLNGDKVELLDMIDVLIKFNIPCVSIPSETPFLSSEKKACLHS